MARAAPPHAGAAADRGDDEGKAGGPVLVELDIDHIIVLDEQHLRSVLAEFVRYYNLKRPHRPRRVPDNALIDFLPAKWRRYVFDDQDRIDRRYYELSALWELRAALRVLRH